MEVINEGCDGQKEGRGGEEASVRLCVCERERELDLFTQSGLWEYQQAGQSLKPILTSHSLVVFLKMDFYP